MSPQSASIVNNAAGIILLVVAIPLIRRKYPLGIEKVGNIPVRYILIGCYMAITLFAGTIIATLIKSDFTF